MKLGWILGIGLALVSCSKQMTQPGLEPPPVPVEMVSVKVCDVPLFFEAMGVLKPARIADVRSQVNGMIREVHFTEGQWVEEGALLYTLEQALYAIRVREAEAQRDQNLAHLNNAQKKLDRYKSLSKQDLIAKVEWDELETKIALNEAMLKADEARLASTQLALSYCTIVAPIAGFTGKSSLQAGNMADGKVLVTLIQTDPLFVDFFITEKELQHITTSTPSFKIFTLGHEECLGQGVVAFIDHSIDSVTGRLAARGKLEKGYTHLRPGQSVRIHLFFGNKEKAMLIPMRAVRTNQNGPYVFSVKEDNTVEIRSIKLGPEEKGLIVVEEGLLEVDRVITEGQARLFSGSKIEEVQ